MILVYNMTLIHQFCGIISRRMLEPFGIRIVDRVDNDNILSFSFTHAKI